MALLDQQKIGVPASAGTVLYANADDLNQDPTQAQTQTQQQKDQGPVYDVLSNYAPEPQGAEADPVKDTGFQAKGYDPSTFQAQTQDVQSEGLVENRLTGLLAKSNPYMKQAETMGKQRAAQRGLLNTSMGVGAAESARISAALPVAQQDAQSVQQQSMANQQYENQARQFNASITTDANKYFADIQNQGNLAVHDANVREQLARFDQTRAMDLETLKSRYSIMENRDSGIAQMYSNYLNDVAQVLSNEDLSGERRADALDALGAGITSIMDFYSGVSGPLGAAPGLPGSPTGGAGGYQPPATTPTEGAGAEAPADEGAIPTAGEGESPTGYSKDPQDPFSYKTVDEMPYTMRQAWTTQYGTNNKGETIQPSQIADLKQGIEALRGEWREYIKDGTSFRSSFQQSPDGTLFTNPSARKQYREGLLKLLKETGLADSFHDFPKKEVAADNWSGDTKMVPATSDYIMKWLA